MIKAYKKYKIINKENEHYFEDRDTKINLLNNCVKNDYVIDR